MKTNLVCRPIHVGMERHLIDLSQLAVLLASLSPARSRLAAQSLLTCLLLGIFSSSLSAQSSPVPNGSFESPETTFADPRLDSWQKSPQPSWYQGGDQFPWDQLIGQFINTPVGTSNHIDNVEGKQAAFMFALPDVAISQDYNTLSGTNTTPSHEFNQVFEVGKSYALTVGLVGGGGGMSNGATFEISFYYQDAASNRVSVAALTVTNTADLFPTNTHLVDFQVRTPIVKASDAWAGQHIGVRLASTASFALQGGYWDVDNVRLTESLVPNGSFESPETSFADPRLDSWQKSPQPSWYQGGDQFPWDQLIGQFINTPVGTSNHIDNVEGKQAAFMFALPDVAISQDYNTLSGTNTTPSHDFNQVFEVGKSYALTVGLVGGGGGMSNGATFQISLYYRDAASNRVTVAATSITNTASLFPTNTHLVDFQARVPAVKATDPWAGQHIGIQLASTVGFDLQGGYWDVDNVRLKVATVESGSNPILTDFHLAGSQFQFNLKGSPGAFEILTGTTIAAPLSAWTSIGTVTNVNGSVPFVDTQSATNAARFYRARQLP